MSENNEVIAGLQAIVTGLSQQATGHAIQSRIFASQGFSKLAAKYAEHTEEEQKYVNLCIDRLLDLGAEVKNEAKPETPVYGDVVEWLKYDLKISKEGLPWLAKIMEAAKCDVSTYDMLKDYYKDEEEDMYWAELQLELIEKIGLQNWLTKQI
ncbi:MAG: bacterioferritin (cytochrome b1) [Alphaproteobacteria bacterium]|nr:bacterioferritin (cytochrome b1) [Alphaproteobacteria bacterium]